MANPVDRGTEAREAVALRISKHRREKPGRTCENTSHTTFRSVPQPRLEATFLADPETRLVSSHPLWSCHLLTPAPERCRWCPTGGKQGLPHPCWDRSPPTPTLSPSLHSPGSPAATDTNPPPCARAGGCISFTVSLSQGQESRVPEWGGGRRG